MMCPVCKSKVDSSQHAFCPHCAWDLKNDLTLNTYLGSIPEKEMSDYRQRLEIARKNWEYLQRMKESTSQEGQQQEQPVDQQKSAPPSASVKEQARTSDLRDDVKSNSTDQKDDILQRLESRLITLEQELLQAKKPVRKQQIFTKLGHGGVELPDDTFQSQGWLMTLDNRTGLIWELKTYANKDEQYAWDECNTFIKRLNRQHFGGFSDWRLPSRGELESIVDRTGQDPAINTEFFPNTVSSVYWSATTLANGTDFEWRVDFRNGYVNYFVESSIYYVRAVRAGK